MTKSLKAEYSFLRVSASGKIAWVTISRQGDRNSINSALMKELAACLGELEAAGLRAVIFTGAGDEYFIGGADGIEMMQCSPDEAQAFSRRIQNLFNRMEASPLILVAAINGLCFGGGFEFAMACDLRVAAHKARIGLPETKVGLIPGGGGTQRLPRLAGSGLAMEMILTGKLYDGQAAANMGLVNAAAPDAELAQKAEGLLARVLRQPQYALSRAKAAVKASSRLGLAEGLRAEAVEFSHCFTNTFFQDLMREQLRQGSLKTTEKLPEGFMEEEK